MAPRRGRVAVRREAAPPAPPVNYPVAPRTPMPTDKNAMAMYVRVVEAGSFSKAAAREGMPVSTVSRKIADLEKSLGVRLLERSIRQLRMTEIGQGYFESCRR